MMAGAAFIIVFLIWIAANPLDIRQSKRSGFGAVGAGLANIWASLKDLDGVFRGKTVQPDEIDDEYIRELERRVFPQFENVNNGQNQ